jgi:hypothetical protein
LKILHNNEISRELWADLLAKTSFSSPFQTPEYFDVTGSIKGYNPEVFALYSSGKLKIIMLVILLRESGFKGIFSRRGIIFGGPLIFNATTQELSFFLTESYHRLKGKAIYLETRNFFDYTTYKESFFISGWNYIPYLDVTLNLEGINRETLTSLFNYNRRREIKQTISLGTTYSQCSQENEILEIYQILKELYSNKVKLPLPPFEYFFEYFKAGMLKVFIVIHEGKTIGGSFCPILPDKGLYTYYYCGLRNYNKRIFPTHLAILAALEYAIDNNIPNIYFMGAGRPGIEYGIRKYKLEFGGDLVENGRFLKVLNPFFYNLGKFGIKVMKIFPL